MNRLRQRFLKSRKTINTRKQRRLTAESLEGRRLLAADIAVPMEGLNPHHNYVYSTDTNRDFQTTPIDALLVINRLNRANSLVSGELGSTNSEGVYPDVNNDGVITPVDALNIINKLSRGEGETEPLLGLQLDVSQNNQSLLRADGPSLESNPMTTRDFTLEVGEKFNLEVRWDYNAPSPFDPALGAFTVYADILATNKTAFAPVLSETQTLTISENLEDGRAGTLELSLPGGTETAVLTFTDLVANNKLSRIAAAIESLGYEAGSIGVFESGVRTSRSNSETGVGDPFVYNIRYNGDAQEFANVPPLQITNKITTSSGTPVNLTTSLVEVPVYVDNDESLGLNPDAFRFNIDFRSSNLNEAALYTSAPSGSYLPDATDDVIFNEVGGFAASIATGGLPQIVQGFGQEVTNNYTGKDFEAFSLELQVISAASPFEFRLDLPDLVGNQLTVFGNDEALTASMIKIDLVDDPAIPGDGTGLVRATFIEAAQDITIGADTLTVVEDTPKTIDPVANDSALDGSALSIKATGGFTQPTNGSVSRDGTTNTLTYTPNLNYNGPDSFTYTVVSANGDEATGTIEVMVSAVNDPPTAAADSGAGLTTAETTPLVIEASRLLANDSKGPANESAQVLSVTGAAATATTKGSVSFANNQVTYTPTVGELGTDTFNYTISDGAGGTATGTVTVVVTDVNSPPVAIDDTITAVEDTPLTFDVSTLLNNDTDDNNVKTLLSVEPASKVVLNGSQITYTPPANVFGANADSFTYTMSDGVNPAVTATVRVNITADNDPPEAVDDNLTVDEGLQPRTLTVLSNDTAGPGETGSLKIVDLTNPATGQGTVTISTDQQSLIYTAPSATFVSDAVNFTYTIEDAQGERATANVSLTVVPTVRPRAVGEVVNIDEDSGLVEIRVLGNDLANDGATVTLESFDFAGFPAEAGVLQFNNGGTDAIKTDDFFTFTPAQDFFGDNLEFTYAISDTSGNDAASIAAGANIATVTINVAAKNDPPTFVEDSVFTVDEDQPLMIGQNAIGNDLSGPANENQSISITSAASQSDEGGTLTLSNGIITYQPAEDFFGDDFFTYTISDGVDSVSATANISVLSINDAPQVNDLTRLTQGSGEVVFTRSQLLQIGSSNASTPGPANEAGQTMTIISAGANGASSMGAGVVLNADQSVTYTPIAGFSGSDTFQITVRDNGTPNATKTATVTVTNNAAPVAVVDSVTVFKGLPRTITFAELLGNDTDAEGDPLTIKSITQPVVGTATIDLNAKTITLSVAQSATAASTSFSYTLSDGFSDVPGTVNVTLLDFIPSTISGSVFVDSMTEGGRNGVKDDGEIGLGAIRVTLSKPGSAPLSVLTDAYGNYTFSDVAPGEYTLSYETPSGVNDNDLNPNSIAISIPAQGDQNITDQSFTADGFSSTAGSSLERFTASYLLAIQRANPSLTDAELDQMSNQGVVIGLDAAGQMTFMHVKGGSGFADAASISVVMSVDGEQMRVTKLDSNGNESAPVTIDKSRFISIEDPITGDKYVRILGNVVFPINAAATGEGEASFSDYADAVDQILAGV